MPGPNGDHSPYMDAYREEQRKLAEAIFKDMPRYDPFAEMQCELDQLRQDRKQAEEAMSTGQTIVVLDEQDSVPFKMGGTSFLNPPLRLLATPQLLDAIKNMAMTEAESTDGPALTAWLALYAAAADLVKLTGDA